MSVSDALRQRDLEEQVVLMAGIVADLLKRQEASEARAGELEERVGKLVHQLAMAQGSINAMRAKAGLAANGDKGAAAR